MEPKCPVCRHKDVNEINRDMVLFSMSSRKASVKYKIPHQIINKHRPHITKNLALAVERREMDATDRLLQDTEMLWNKVQGVLEESENAVKTQAVTVGTGKGAKTVYREYKDLGAVMAAIKVAHENRRLFGDATGAIKPTGQGGQVGIYLSIAMPRMDNTPASIEATVLNTDESQEIEAPPSTVFGLDDVVIASDPKSSIPHAEAAAEAGVAHQRKRDVNKYRITKTQLKESVRNKIWGDKNDRQKNTTME